MFGIVHSRLRQPVLFLILSLLAGIVFDAMAEWAVAQQVEPGTQEEPTVQPAPITPLPRQEDDQDPRYMPLEGMAQIDDELPLMKLDDIYQPLVDINIDIQEVTENRPPDLSFQMFRDAYSTNYPNSFQYRLASWEASNIRYQPLYFECVSLERYGYTHRPVVQPVTSAAHFGVALAMLPYNLIHDRPGKCVYPLGFCRPGSPAPQVHTRWFWKHYTQ